MTYHSELYNLLQIKVLSVQIASFCFRFKQVSITFSKEQNAQLTETRGIDDGLEDSQYPKLNTFYQYKVF